MFCIFKTTSVFELCLHVGLVENVCNILLKCKSRNFVDFAKTR